MNQQKTLPAATRLHKVKSAFETWRMSKVKGSRIPQFKKLQEKSLYDKDDQDIQGMLEVIVPLNESLRQKNVSPFAHMYFLQKNQG